MQAFLLIINCEFHTQMDRDSFQDEFAKLAQHVQTESDTLAYETAVADNNPNKVVIYERCGCCVGQITCAVSAACDAGAWPTKGAACASEHSFAAAVHDASVR
jgi:hypothetical protein